MRRVLSFAALLLITAGCSSNAATKPTPTPASLAAHAHCTDVQPVQKLYADKAVFCLLGGKRVEVATFTDNTARDKYVSVGEGFPNVAVHIGDKWAAATSNGADLSPFGGSTP